MRGVYVLIFKVKRSFIVDVGKLGRIFFEKGTYAYVGSAQKNFEMRIKRHLSSKKNKFWHIDYLLSNKNVVCKKIFYLDAEKKYECKISQRFFKTEFPIPKFGCSDCFCGTHLFRLINSIEDLAKELSLKRIPVSKFI